MRAIGRGLPSPYALVLLRSLHVAAGGISKRAPGNGVMGATGSSSAASGGIGVGALVRVGEGRRSDVCKALEVARGALEMLPSWKATGSETLESPRSSSSSRRLILYREDGVGKLVCTLVTALEM